MKKALWISGSTILLLIAGFYGWQTFHVPPAPVAPPVNQKALGEFMAQQGLLMAKRRYYSSQITVYENMRKQLPDNLDLKRRLASAYFGVEEFDKALPLLETLEPTTFADAEVFYELGAIQFKRGLTKEARESINKALQLNPKHSEAQKLSQLFPKTE